MITPESIADTGVTIVGEINSANTAAKRCLIVLSGDNGSGKTTFLNVLTGHVPALTGSIALDGIQLSNRGPLWATPVRI